MDTINRKSTWVGVATLVVGLVLGLGIGVWGIRNTHAKNNSRADTSATSSAAAPNVSGAGKAGTGASDRSSQWDPFQHMEQMQQEIDHAIRQAMQQFELGPNATMFRPDAGRGSFKCRCEDRQ